MVAGLGNKALIETGGGSLDRSDALDRAKADIKVSGADFAECAGVKPDQQILSVINKDEVAMNKLRWVSLLVASVFILCMGVQSMAQNTDASLSEKQKSIVVIAAFTASGDLDRLKPALNAGLDAGLTVNEIKEILVQMYAYTGFPRSLNGLNTFAGVLQERKAKGIKDEGGREASALPKDMDKNAYGAKVRAQLTGRESDMSGLPWQVFSPTIDTFLKEHLFADIFARDVLDFKSRELATIGALAALRGALPQLQSHLGISLNVGLTPPQLQAFADLITVQVGAQEGANAREALAAVLKSREQSNLNAPKGIHKMSNDTSFDSIFARGPENTAYAKYFVGQSYLNILSRDGVFVANVTFEPGCRNNWHIHKAEKGGGQILLCTAGKGWYQEWNKPARALRPGDVVHIPAGVKHWHGAAKDSWFSHLAVEVPGENAANEWLEPVAEADYNALD